MASIEIPFSREMAIAAIDGKKVATTRSEQKGKIGDTFTLISHHLEYSHDEVTGPVPYHPELTFRLLEIMAVDLETVKNLYFRFEGFDSPESFEKTWRALHRGHFTTDKLYYMHVFGRIA